MHLHAVKSLSTRIQGSAQQAITLFWRRRWTDPGTDKKHQRPCQHLLNGELMGHAESSTVLASYMKNHGQLSPGTCSRHLTGCAHAEFGAWYPRFAVWDMHKPWERYQKDMNLLLDQRLRAYSASVLWRAYGPTHFGTDTGTFTGESPPPHSSQLGTWRAEASCTAAGKQQAAVCL